MAILGKLLFNFEGFVLDIVVLAPKIHVPYHDPKSGAVRNLFLANPLVSLALIGYPEATEVFRFLSEICIHASTRKLTHQVFRF